MKGLGLKIGAFLAIMGIIAGIFNAVANRDKASRKALEASAYSRGVSDANLATTTTANQKLVDQTKQIADMQDALNKKVVVIRQASVNEQRTISNYDAGAVAAKHPEEVEKWANDTTNGIFNDIAEATK